MDKSWVRIRKGTSFCLVYPDVANERFELVGAWWVGYILKCPVRKRKYLAFYNELIPCSNFARDLIEALGEETHGNVDV